MNEIDPVTMARRRPGRLRHAPLLLAVGLMLAGCNGPLDLDLRDVMGNPEYDTTDAAIRASAPPPKPDRRGVISYPTYQVAVARRGDTVRDVAARLGVDAEALARENRLQPDDRLRPGEVLALPGQVAEPGRTGTAEDAVDVTEIASAAIDSIEPTAPRAAPAGPEPVRHRVQRGETAYSIARLYGVSVRALAEWNGLGPDFAIREGQTLLIPLPRQDETPKADSGAPGQGSQVPAPPSAARPLPARDDTTEPAPDVPSPELAPAAPAAAADTAAAEAPGASGARLQMPVAGSVIRGFAPGRNEGIDIAAPAGTPVRAAADGIVGAVTRDTERAQIVVIKHDDNLLTVYQFVDGVRVGKGERVRKGQEIGSVAAGNPPYLHFEVREGFDAVDPERYLP